MSEVTFNEVVRMERTGSDVSALLEKVRAGDDEAAVDLLAYCEGALLKAVRARLNHALRGKFDSQDFVQAVWASFFANLSVLERFENRDDVVKFVVRVATNKVIDETRRRLVSQKWNINRERPLDSFDSSGDSPLLSEEPTPDNLVASREKWERILSRQPERDRTIFEFRAAGQTPRQIARQMDIHERTVSRIVARIAAEFVRADEA